MLEHIRDAKTPKEVWDIFATLFSKKNDTRLQLLENELLSIAQCGKTIAQYFHKVKLICREISELDPSAPIGEARIKIIIIHGLRPEYRGFIAAIQGWPTQPSLLEFENLLAGQEAMAKQMGGLSLKDEEEALYTNKNKGNFKRHTGGSKKDGDKGKSYHGNGGSRPGGASKNYGDRKKFSGECYNCGKVGHMAKDCWSKKRFVQSNTATSNSKENSEDDWDAEALMATEEKDLALTTTPEQIDYKNDWIVDSGCSNHMTGDKEKLQNLSQYKGARMVVTADNSRLPIAHVGKTVITPRYNSNQVPLQDVYHVPGMKKNLLSVAQLTSSGHYVIFGPENVKVYRNLKISEAPTMEGQRLESLYVMSAESAYIDKTRKKVDAQGTSSTRHTNRHNMCRMSVCKFDKKAIRCIFVGYDSQRKGWKCCDPTSERCYTSRNVVFDEASSWWTTEKEVLPESKDLEDKVQQKMREHIVQLQSGSDESGGPNDNDAEQRVAQSPWQTGIYQHPNEEERPNEVEELTPQSQLRRSTRTRRPNPKYANAAIVEEAVEPETFEKASQSSEWMTAMKQEIDALQQNQTWDLIPKPRDVKPISCKWVYKIKHRPDESIQKELAVSTFYKMVARGFIPDVKNCNRILRNLRGTRQWSQVRAVYKEMVNSGIQLTIVTYNTMLDSFCKEGKADEALRILGDMESRDSGCLPNDVTYNVIINGLSKNGEFNGAKKLLDKMQKSGKELDGWKWHSSFGGDLQCSNLWVVYQWFGNLKEALYLFDHMRDARIRPNVRTFNILIYGYCQMGALEGAQKLKEKMIHSGCMPDVYSYTLLMKGSCKFGNFAMSEAYFDEMLQRGLQPDCYAYTTRIMGGLRVRPAFNAFQLREEMITRGICPDTVTYNVLIDGCCKMGNLTEAYNIWKKMKIQLAYELFFRMQGKGLSPNTYTYTLLINANCNLGNWNEAFRLYAEMLKKEVLPDSCTWNVLFKHFGEDHKCHSASFLESIVSAVD
ncbi:hypothetical protein ZIOFF_050443 [Zingiber officinale]|uniref:CCHC-type domain-containing protein n=1 Tax=Zingiber officinale TaxID=94328 RepID=A0A8J5KTN0_ZINOF|nr:hypothetical protein ZIOFF_050443 [Zingiber officinale]